MKLTEIIESLKRARLHDFHGNPLESLEAFRELEALAIDKKTEPTLTKQSRCGGCGRRSPFHQVIKYCPVCDGLKTHHPL